MINSVDGCQKKFLLVCCLLSALVFGGLFGCWLRVIETMAGGTWLTLSVFVGVALSGALSGVILMLVRRHSNSELSASLCLILLSVAAYQLFLLHTVGGLGSAWQQLLLQTSRTYTMFLKILFKSALIFVAVFSILGGALYMRALCKLRNSALILSVGVVAFFILGWWLFALAIPTTLSFKSTLILLTLLPGILAALAVARGDRLQRIAAVMIFLVAAGALLYTIKLPLEHILSRGTFGRLVHRDSGFAFADPVEEHVAGGDVISIYQDQDYHFVYEMNNRPVMFGSRYHTARVLNAYIPLLLRPQSDKVLLVGAEAGLFAPYLIRGGVESPSFCAANRRTVELAMRQDARTGGRVDAENLFDKLRKHKFAGTYDLIVLTPEPVYKRGCTRWFSRTNFRRAAKMTAPAGVVALHLNARALSKAAFATLLSEMRAEFKHLQVWCVGAHEWMLAGSMTPLTLNAESMLQLLERDAVFQDFVRAGKLTLADVLACMICDERGVDRWLHENEERVAPALIAWRAPRTVLEGGAALMTPAFFETAREFGVSDWLHRGELDAEIYDGLVARVERNIAGRLSAVMALANMDAAKAEEGLRYAREAASINPDDVLLVQFKETLELEGRRRIAIGDYKGAVRCYENMLSLDRESAQAHYGLGYCLRANGDMQNAYLHFARAVVGAPSQTHYRIELAGAALNIGQFETADIQYRKILEAEPDNAHVMLLYAEALLFKGREKRDSELAIKLAQQACDKTSWKNAEIVTKLADIYIEAGRVMEGMGIKQKLQRGESLRGNRTSQ